MIAATAVTAIGLLAFPSSPAHADPASPVGHCTLVVGDLDYSPALTALPKSTVIDLHSEGSNCVDVNLTVGSDAVSVSRVTIVGQFSGSASTTTSNFSGGGTLTYHLGNGAAITETFQGVCVAGALAICPVAAVITSGPEDGDTLEITPMPVNVNPLGPVAHLSFAEVALTRAQAAIIK
ncbi:hypothetical protein [Hamadaea tsunoensis]|uniref:hypothetical protein n=1 Tax=Hamadaea tsunoensis TaxID=53368 RepID=UPI0003FD4DB5|nr:hypothetical protein [Hamadaea tsunoensis]